MFRLYLAASLLSLALALGCRNTSSQATLAPTQELAPKALDTAAAEDDSWRLSMSTYTWLPAGSEALERLEMKEFSATVDGTLVWLDLKSSKGHELLKEVSGPIVLSANEASLADPAVLETLVKLSEVHKVGLRLDDVSDASLAKLETLPNLHGLLIARGEFTDADLAHFEGLSELRLLGLYQMALRPSPRMCVYFDSTRAMGQAQETEDHRRQGSDRSEQHQGYASA
ncbi:MAG: hypothetical protein GY811_02270 [Myxococcales bacterium]|nr:hypothetical protein [Myxococcales bacterium]